MEDIPISNNLNHLPPTQIRICSIWFESWR